jgi:hypothetical protein
MAKPKSTRKRSEAHPTEDPAAVFRGDVEQIMVQYDQGDRLQLFHALVRCRQYGIAPSDRILGEIEKGWRRIINGEARALNDAFGVEPVKGMHLSAEQDRVSMAFKVYQEIKRRMAAGGGGGMKLWRAVGKEYGISGSVARNYYLDVKKVME